MVHENFEKTERKNAVNYNTEINSINQLNLLSNI